MVVPVEVVTITRLECNTSEFRLNWLVTLLAVVATLTATNFRHCNDIPV